MTGLLENVRGHLWATVVGSVRDGYPAYDGLVLSDGAVTSGGAHISDPICVGDTKCLAAHHAVGFYRTSQPVSHFWPLQLVESGILPALAAIAVAVAFRVLRRHHA